MSKRTFIPDKNDEGSKKLTLPTKHLKVQSTKTVTFSLQVTMGPGLADNRLEARANGQEWRTPPLWGIGACFQAIKIGRAHV